MQSFFEEFIELNGMLMSFFGVGFVGGIGVLIRLLKKANTKREQIRDEQEARLKSLEAANLALLHYRIYRVCTLMLEQGYATIAELDNLEYFWEAYAALGGNGTGEKLYRDVQALPVKKG